ncbi:DUF4293 domain-containing protein [Rapidithrix thailandica]|uniref:DUF4293 domain-containing protein n=1 Tax=Rapidithrix thailandica TaxID=413964 RepID=A0AAW9RY65_9BACT
MLQRVQSIFLALVAIAMFSVVFTSIWEKTSSEGTETVVLTALQMVHSKGEEAVNTVNTFYIAALAFLSAAVAIGSIFSYKSRLTQLKLNLLNVLLMAATIGCMVYFLFEGTKYFEVKTNQGAFDIGFYLPAVGLFFNLLANRFIRKDEKLVRSSDRLR